MITMETFNLAVIEEHAFITNLWAKQDEKGRFHEAAVYKHKEKPK